MLIHVDPDSKNRCYGKFKHIIKKYLSYNIGVKQFLYNVLIYV